MTISFHVIGFLIERCFTWRRQKAGPWWIFLYIGRDWSILNPIFFKADDFSAVPLQRPARRIFILLIVQQTGWKCLCSVTHLSYSMSFYCHFHFHLSLSFYCYCHCHFNLSFSLSSPFVIFIVIFISFVICIVIVIFICHFWATRSLKYLLCRIRRRCNNSFVSFAVLVRSVEQYSSWNRV